MKNVKRILSALIAGALLCTGTVFSTVSAEETILCGDIDNDGAITSDDAVFAQYYYSATLTGTEDEFFEWMDRIGSSKERVLASDITGNGQVDADDVVMILKYYSTALLNSGLTPDEIWEKVFAGE